MFTVDSALVQIFVKNVKAGNCQVESVPKLSNLQEMVHQALEVNAE